MLYFTLAGGNKCFGTPIPFIYSIPFYYLNIFLLVRPSLYPKCILLSHFCLYGPGNSDKCNTSCKPIFSPQSFSFFLYIESHN